MGRNDLRVGASGEGRELPAVRDKSSAASDLESGSDSLIRSTRSVSGRLGETVGPFQIDAFRFIVRIILCMIRSATRDDANAICAIYNHYVLNSIITFEETPVAREDMAKRITDVLATLPWLVEENAGRVVGYAYATAWKGRCAYRFAVESTVYVATDAAGQRIGTRLYEALIAELRERGLHSVIGGIALPNAASVALHEKFGFEKVAQFRQVGWKFERWIDVGYWELLI